MEPLIMVVLGTIIGGMARARPGYLVAVSGDSVGGRPAVSVTHRPMP